MKKVKQKIFHLAKYSLSSQLSVLLLLEIILGACIVFITTVIFLELGDEVIEKDLIFFDETILQWLYGLRTPFLTIIMKGITFLGGQYFLGVAIIITILFLLRQHKKDALLFIFILFFGITFNLWLKDVFQRPRPELYPLVQETTFSFPSGHAMNSIVFYGALSYFVFWHMKKRRIGMKLIFSMFILVFLIGVSRIYLGVHYPSDVIAGYMAGIWWLILVLMIEKVLIFLRAFNEYELKKKY